MPSKSNQISAFSGKTKLYDSVKWDKRVEEIKGRYVHRLTKSYIQRLTTEGDTGNE
ncbi:hypothetical protein HK096_011146, partial [Nowakowskiella sp. JEL0078]